MAVARHHLGYGPYMGDDFARALVELINSGDIELKVRSLDLTCKLTEDPEYRKHLASKDVFSQVVKLLTRAVRAEDRSLRVTSACIRGLTFFSRDKPNLMILVNLHGQVDLFALLCRAFHGEGFREVLGSEEEYV